MKSELYYNQDRKRRLFVDLWKEQTPFVDNENWTPPPLGSRFHFYVSSRQELKKTFGGWRTNETNYGFNNLSYDYGYYNSNPIPLQPNNDTFKFRLSSYNVNGVYGPIIIDMGTIETLNFAFFSGSGNINSGGVPSTPAFSINYYTP
ncbi:MAG: hypothetical protein H7325_01690 [Pedobacter sp.]|nr:hypothetical protein [Pedobacter sp.]